MNALAILAALLPLIPEVIGNVEKLSDEKTTSQDKQGASLAILETAAMTAGIFPPEIPWTTVKPLAVMGINYLVAANNRGKWKREAATATTKKK
ncbi:MAG: hypothetical protein HZB29_09735 [Nitrospinae bacterium]|nr:hypothetical protein [Nitrospinota bacterium]